MENFIFLKGLRNKKNDRGKLIRLPCQAVNNFPISPHANLDHYSAFDRLANIANTSTINKRKYIGQ